jgi:hypothetical protein
MYQGGEILSGELLMSTVTNPMDTFNTLNTVNNPTTMTMSMTIEQSEKAIGNMHDKYMS